MSHHAIDYFVTLGRAPGSLQCKTFPVQIDEDSEPLTAETAWQEAITDIILLGPGEELPDEDSWTFLVESYGGHPLDPPYIAFRRRIFSKRLDHITQVKFVAPGEVVPQGYELLRTIASGKSSGYIKPHGYLAIKRATVDENFALNGQEMIFDICVIKTSMKDDIPDQFFPIEKDSVGAIAAFSTHDTLFIMRKLPPMGVLDLGYAASTIDRYPLQDHKDAPLPAEALPVFAFPRYLRLLRGKNNEYPLPVFFTFVFTDQDGRHLYAACLKFFEVLPPDMLEPIAREIYGETFPFEFPADESVFCPKIICVLTRKPFYRAMRRYLRHVYSISLSTAVCPLEHFISSLVHQVPLPVEGGRPFHVVLDAALISVKSKPMSPIIFHVPPARFFPMMDLDFAGPLRCLSVDVMLAVFALMLREAKLIFLSCSNTMLTETMETLRMLLFPLTWASCFVSRLPTSLHGLLQAPGGLMIGVHMERTQSTNIDSKKFIERMHHNYPLVNGTYMIDLTSNSIHQFDGKSVEKLQNNDLENILRTLPTGPKVRLKAKLYQISEEYHIAPQTTGLEEMDSAFDFQADEEDAISKEKWDEFPTLEVRDSFMSFMIDLLGDYPKYILPPAEDLFAETYRTFREEFAVDEYLGDADASCRPALDYLMETQMFSVLLQNRSEGNAEEVVFFEQAAELQRELGLSVGGHGHGITKSPHGICELPLSIYILLNKEQEWSALSKTMQQQIISALEVSGKKVYRISCLSQNSLSPLRGNNPHISWNTSHQNIGNQKLIDLLMFNDFTFTTPQHDQDDESESPYYSVARKELDRDEDLQLSNEEFGPVVIAGPTVNGTMDYVAPEDDSARTYTYPSWPNLQPDLLQNGEHSVHPRLKQIRLARTLALSQLNPRLYRMIRSPAERLLAVGNHVGKGKEKDKQLVVHAEVAPILAALMDISSISMLFISLRILNNVKPTSDIFQLLGIIAELEQVGLLPSLNESIWRSILIGCGAVGGTIMRRMAYVLFQCLESVRTHAANALTYGRYVQALNAKKLNLPETSNPGDILDPFLFLEEVGFTWYIQRSALSAQNQSIRMEETNMMKRTQSNASDTSANGASSAKISKKGVTLQANAESARIAAAKLNLQYNRSFLPFMKPIQTAASSLPTPCTTISSSSLGLDYVRNKAKQQHEAFLQSCSSSNFKPYPNPSTPRSRAESLLSMDRKASKDSLSGTPERLTSMISSIGTEIGKSSTMQVVSKLSTGSTWLLGLGKSTSAATKNTNDNNKQVAKTSISSNAVGQNSSWRNIFSSRTATPVSTPPPTSSTVHSFENATQLTPDNNYTNDGHIDMKKINALASTLVFEDDEENTSNTSDESSGVARAEGIETELKRLSITTSHTVTEPSNSNQSTENEGLDSAVDDSVPSEPMVAPSTPISGTHRSSADENKKNDDSNTRESVEIGEKKHPAPCNLLNELNITEFNNKVLDMFIQYYMDLGKVVSIHNYTPCLDCGYALMDEEILALWCRTAGLDIHSGNSRNGRRGGRNRSASQIVMDTSHHHKIHCPHCSNEIIPKLFVYAHRKKVDKEHDHPLSVPGADIALDSKYMEEVSYLSPFLLRTEVEEALLKVGEQLVDVEILHKHSPTIFWNVLWYTARCSLPAGLFSNCTTGLYHLPLVAAWRKETVISKAMRILQGIPGDMLEVKDIFFFASEEELRIICDDMLTHLDFSPAGMRQALLHLSQISSLFIYAEEKKIGIARMVYVSMLLLSVHAGHFPMYDRKKTSLARDLSQDCVFDKVFVDAVKCVMAPADFVMIKCSEQELITAASNKAANVVRAIYGVLA